mmetsp:Transcript_43273/g.94227  ORF Transcript_43273/g.94227 Transcript_43273/m.94227 type:complete len:256 (-) Transcript_43273:343-1110(-)
MCPPHLHARPGMEAPDLWGYEVGDKVRSKIADEWEDGDAVAIGDVGEVLGPFDDGRIEVMFPKMSESFAAALDEIEAVDGAVRERVAQATDPDGRIVILELTSTSATTVEQEDIQGFMRRLVRTKGVISATMEPAAGGRAVGFVRFLMRTVEMAEDPEVLATLVAACQDAAERFQAAPITRDNYCQLFASVATAIPDDDECMYLDEDDELAEAIQASWGVPSWSVFSTALKGAKVTKGKSSPPQRFGSNDVASIA